MIFFIYTFSVQTEKVSKRVAEGAIVSLIIHDVIANAPYGYPDFV